MSVSEIPEQAVADLAEARRVQNRDWVKDAIGMGAYHVPRLEAALRRITEDAVATDAAPGSLLDTIQRQEDALRELELAATPVRRELARAGLQLERDARSLDALVAKWDRTMAAAGPEIPPEVVERAKETRDVIGNARRVLQENQGLLLSLQSRVAELSAAIDELHARHATFGGFALRLLFQRDSPPVWDSTFWSAASAGLASAPDAHVRDDLAELNAYLHAQQRTLLLHGLLVAAIAGILHVIRARVGILAGTDPALLANRAIFDMPIVTALLLGLLAAGWFHPSPPHGFTILLGLVSAPPVYLFTRRLVERDAFPLFQIVIAYYVVEWLRSAWFTQAALARPVLMVEALLLILFLLRFGRPRTQRADGGTHLDGTRIGLWIGRAMLFIAAGALVANAVGYAGLSNFLLRAGLSSAYAAVVLYALTRAIGGVVRALLQVPPFSFAAGVRRHRDMIAMRLTRWISWAALLWWFVVTLRAFGVLALVEEWGATLWATSWEIGSLQLPLRTILIFAVVLGITYPVSKLVQFFLEEEIFSRVQLDRGLPHAVSTTVHYLILVLGFMLALSATGIDTTRFAIVAGALTVGIGFGLQNIVNNFVSGLIVLFERPVKTGDTIQLGDVVGRVRRIGIRATIIESTSGAAVIIPNGKLISDQVTNWTPTGELRLISVPIVAKTELPTDAVKALLLEVAGSHDKLLPIPAPEALLLKRNVDTLEYELRVWTHAVNDWVRIRSDLIAAIDTALRRLMQAPLAPPP